MSRQLLPQQRGHLLKRKIEQNGACGRNHRHRMIAHVNKSRSITIDTARARQGVVMENYRRNIPQEDWGGEGEPDEHNEDREESEDEEDENDDVVLDDVDNVHPDQDDKAVDEDDVNMEDMEEQKALDEEFYLNDLTRESMGHKRKITLPHVSIMVSHFLNTIRHLVISIFTII